MKRTVYASEKARNIDYAEELNAQSLETVCKRYNLNYELDDMYNINIYLNDETPEDITEWYPMAEETEDRWSNVQW